METKRKIIGQNVDEKGFYLILEGTIKTLAPCKYDNYGSPIEFKEKEVENRFYPFFFFPGNNKGKYLYINTKTGLQIVKDE